MRRVAAALTAAAALGLPAATAAASPIQTSTSLTPRWLFFADFVTAHVEVTFDPKVVAADSVRVETAVAPWESIGPTSVSTSRTRSSVHRSWRFVVACLSIDCLPRGTAVQRFHLPPVRIVGRTRGGSVISLRRAWPMLRIAGRFAPATTTGLRPVFRLDTALPPLTYRTDPSTLALVLTILGALLAAAGVAAGGAEAFRWRAARRAPVQIPPLAVAVELLREAQRRSPDDRRRAASLVARTLPSETDGGLGSHAAQLAWSPAEPAAEELEELAQDLESRLGGSG